MKSQIKEGTHVERNENATSHRGKKILIEPKEPAAQILIEIDGESGGSLPATFEVVEKAILMVVPKRYLDSVSQSSS